MSKIKVINIRLTLDQAINQEQEMMSLKKAVVKILKLSLSDVIDLVIKKKAIDARKKPKISMVYSVEFSTRRRIKPEYFERGFCQIAKDQSYKYPDFGSIQLKNRPVIVGFGPAGIFSAYLLAKAGYNPLVIEQGLDVDNRDKAYLKFLETKKFSKQASIQFGEGGAGTYSDGKLTTSINDERSNFVLNLLAEHGANKEITYLNKPHVGTDVLKRVIKSIRMKIIRLGGEFRFNCELTDFIVKGNQIQSIIVNDSEVIPVDLVLLGIGHSSRKTFELLVERRLNIEPKPFAVGLRVEHKQSMIDASQYGEAINHPGLKPADYKLVHHDDLGRVIYSFCMCPGGYVVCGSSEENGVVTNGMSESKRDGLNANAAILVNVKPDDFKDSRLLAGMYFQRDLERKAFIAGGSDYSAPVQRVVDYLNDSKSLSFGQVLPTYLPSVKFASFNQILPDFINKSLKRALLEFDKIIPGFADENALLTGVETRSSSPIRILRDDSFQSNISGLYPMGEGSGYSGGIMSSAVDGIKVAESIIKKYQPFEKKYE
jgi:hypothetical protein